MNELERIESKRNETRYGFAWLEKERGQLFSSWIGTGKQVLDVGCRDGTLTRHYADGNYIVGADIDRRALELGVFDDTCWMNAGALWPFPDESFDVVVCAEILEHSNTPMFMVYEAHRVLRNSGIFIGSIPNGYHWKHLLLGEPQSIDHKRQYRYSDLTKLLIGGLGRFCSCRIVPIGILKGVRLPEWLMRICPPLVQTWTFRCCK